MTALLSGIAPPLRGRDQALLSRLAAAALDARS
jgi:hypothetical protein